MSKLDMITIFFNNFMMLKRLLFFHKSVPKLPSIYSAQYHSLIPQQAHLNIIPNQPITEMSHNQEIENRYNSICPQSIIIDNIYECRNKRHEQARRKRLKRKNGTKNKVRWT